MSTRFIAFSALVAMALTGCSDDRGNRDQGAEREVAAAGILNNARGDDLVSDEQVAILEGGDVAFEDYEAAVGRAIACLGDAGIHVVGTEPVQDGGYPEIRYSYAASSVDRTDAQTDAVAQACLRRHSMYIEAAYFNSTAVREAVLRQFEIKRGSIVECLRGFGMEVNDDATSDELNELIYSRIEEGTGTCMPQFVDD